MTPKQAYELAELFATRRAFADALVKFGQERLLKPYAAGEEGQAALARDRQALAAAEARLEEVNIMGYSVKTILGLRDDDQE